MKPVLRNIKGRLAPILRFMLANRLSRPILNGFIGIGKWLEFEKSKLMHEQSESFLRKQFYSREVLSGFFKGMKYPAFIAAGSALFPKFLGSYEYELQECMQKLSKNNYLKIVDVGCAEGFYAVGLALRFPDAHIIAFDTDETALSLCGKMAEENGVLNRMTLEKTCTSQTFNHLDLTDRTLVICDCEGFEVELFNVGNVQFFKNADLVIELHPFQVANVKKTLFEIFKHTHAISYISSFDNSRKRFDFARELRHFAEFDQLKAVEEGRPMTMEWMIALAPNENEHFDLHGTR
jgi:Methyltransferase domain